MTLLSNREKAHAGSADAAQKDADRPANGVSTKAHEKNGKLMAPHAHTSVPPPVDTLRTLISRLQSQIDRSDTEGDPEARALLGTVQRRMSQAKDALSRIEQGKYGICADCDKPIENERLVLQPVATRCISCQSKAEWRGLA